MSNIANLGMNSDEIPDFSDLMSDWYNKNGHNFEGESGVRRLCRFVHDMGYVDCLHYGQFAHNGSYGDLITFLEDNPGAIDAIIRWIKEQNCEEWTQNLESTLNEKEEV